MICTGQGQACIHLSQQLKVKDLQSKLEKNNNNTMGKFIKTINIHGNLLIKIWLIGLK